MGIDFLVLPVCLNLRWYLQSLQLTKTLHLKSLFYRTVSSLLKVRSGKEEVFWLNIRSQTSLVDPQQSINPVNNPAEEISIECLQKKQQLKFWWIWIQLGGKMHQQSFTQRTARNTRPVNCKVKLRKITIAYDIPWPFHHGNQQLDQQNCFSL